MSAHRPRRERRDIDRAAAERLLDDPAGRRGPQGPERLANVLSAASAPAQAQELSGERAALAAFRERRLTTASRPRRTSMIKFAIAKLISAKIAAAAVVVTATGGIALAATTGAIPNPLDNRPATPADASPSAHPEPGDLAKASPNPSILGLCVAFHAKAQHEQGAALQSPAFRALVEAAGSVEAVGEFCAEVQASGSPGKPTWVPTGKPTWVPTGKPDGLPTLPDMPAAHDGTTPPDLPVPPDLPTNP